MTKQRPLISVICCAHNEEEYVDKAIQSILNALKNFSAEVLFVADRCTDGTVNIARRYDVQVIEKKWKKWENSYAESLQTGYLKAKGNCVSIIDADIAVPNTFFRNLLPRITGSVASAAAEVVTYPDTFWNRMTYAWEKTYNVAPLGREPRGAVRLILKEVLDKFGGFCDVIAPDTKLDMDIANSGFESVSTSAIKAYHLRHLSLERMIRGQIISGRARFSLGIGFKRTVGHSLLRFRPLILNGWLQEWMNRKTTKC